MESKNNNFNEEDKYRLTPKALFYLALQDAGYISDVLNETVQMKLAWIVFKDSMVRNGYAQDEF